MSKKLVIVESPAKARTIGKFLGKGYEVMASKGHIRDLPERTIGVDIEHGFQPKYVLSKEKARTVGDLRRAARICDEIYLAPDPDREGEAIAWHLHETLYPGAKTKPFHRVQYNEVTPHAVMEAFNHPGEIDMNRVNAQQARRVLDRIVGYMVSPMLWRRLHKGLSAGRVQSVALRLVAEREREIQAFKVEEYWVMGAKVRRETPPLDSFEIRLNRMDGQKPAIPHEADAAAIKSDLDNASLKVTDIKTREVSRHALPPFITSTLQQAASSVCSFSPSRTMALAQQLYEGGESGVGLITYMRTDSVNLSKDARDAAEAFIGKNFGPGYFAQNFYKSRESAQEAHEAIRPTDVNRTPESLAGKLEPAALRLYELIWKRFVASLMASARVGQKTVSIEPVKAGMKHTYTFTASASEVLFDGFLKVMALDIRKKKAEGELDEQAEDDDEVETLPPLAVGDPLALIEWEAERKETKPPARYSEASLIKALEANGVGRPSTYAAIIDTLNSRDYTTREKRQVVPTQLGLDVNDLLVSKMPNLFNVGFTAEMEKSLDEVEEGTIQWQAMLENFYKKFKNWLELAKEPPADLAKVKNMLNLLTEIKKWGPVVKRGKKAYSDEKFVASVREQLEKNEKPVSEKQLAALAHIAIRYRQQIADGDKRISALGYEEDIAKDNAAPSLEETMKRFVALTNVPLTEGQNAFVVSLRQQYESGRKLSEKQLGIIDRIIVENSGSIPNFEKVKQDLGIKDDAVEMPVDTESPILVQLLGEVKEWSKPIARGKRTFDDAAFFKSLSDQFSRRHSLSPRQRFAMKRLCFRYKAQIPDFAKYADQLGMVKKSKTDKPEDPSVQPEGTGIPPQTEVKA